MSSRLRTSTAAFRGIRGKLGASLAACAFFAATSLAARARPRSAAAAAPVVVTTAVTPVAGPSLLEREGLLFGESSFGRRGGPPASGISSRRVSLPHLPGPGFILTGADLYRLNCASCHGASGAGTPPEINSVIGPTQATSSAFLQTQMRARGISLDSATARQLAAQSEKAFRGRLEKGGERMPPFRHLQGPEVDSVLAYLQGLGGVPDVREVRVVESVFRVGEHLVKGTCHTCHSATGPGPLELKARSDDAYRRDRPSLEGTAHELTVDQFVAKVHDGTDSGFTGGRGTMPIFYYLTRDEIEAAFLYLLAYPPVEAPLPPPADSHGSVSAPRGGAPSSR